MSSVTGSHNTADNPGSEQPPIHTTTSTPPHQAPAIISGEKEKGNAVSAAGAAAESPETYEQEHVHSVYESIAGHFSSTRYKPWPFIASYLEGRVRPGSVGLDVGCGNGKYMGLRAATGDVHMIGTDRSASLVRIARDYQNIAIATATATAATTSNAGAATTTLISNMTKTPASSTSSSEKGSRDLPKGGYRSDVCVSDGLSLPFRAGAADFALCIAVIHHMSTRERRIAALQSLLECVRPDAGEILVYVWALEQSASSRRRWDETSDQDQLVPWVMKAAQNTAASAAGAKGVKAKKKQKKTKEEGEGPTDSGGDCGIGDVVISGGTTGNAEEAETDVNKDATFQRYYHLYRKGELEEDLRAAGGKVLESGYERDNWWVIGARDDRGGGSASLQIR
ncbi:S-adenosyl-L-methionine-dependent methyltransferase [Xylariaceae sp. FL0255]|nr:S-adenosyl-L-methionine-dependent methyltransferase [Xylariaceae sp. FL0255]